MLENHSDKIKQNFGRMKMPLQKFKKRKQELFGRIDRMNVDRSKLPNIEGNVTRERPVRRWI